MKEKFEKICYKNSNFLVYLCSTALIINTFIVFFVIPFASEEYKKLVYTIMGILFIPSSFLVYMTAILGKYMD